MEKKELLEKYLELVEKEIYPNDKKMVEYVGKNTARVVLLSNGNLVGISKPSINTEFCFGYSDLGQGRTQEQAEAMEEYASREASYFIEENIKKFSWWYNTLLDSPQEIYLRNKYWKSPSDSKLKEIEKYDWWHYANASESTKAELQKVSKEDLQELINAYAEEIKNFEKRLRAYLKRYGTSKLKTWTYWQDE